MLGLRLLGSSENSIVVVQHVHLYNFRINFVSNSLTRSPSWSWQVFLFFDSSYRTCSFTIFSPRFVCFVQQ